MFLQVQGKGVYFVDCVWIRQKIQTLIDMLAGGSGLAGFFLMI